MLLFEIFRMHNDIILKIHKKYSNKNKTINSLLISGGGYNSNLKIVNYFLTLKTGF